MEPTQPKHGVIYKITNTVNGKMYVGKTEVGVAVRWSQHRCAAKSIDSRYHLHLSMRKYGVDSFSMTILEDGIPVEFLAQKEVEWIAKLGTIDPKVGYNQTYGGEGAKHIPATCAKLSEQRREWWENPENRKFFSEELWDAEKRATQRESSKRWRATSDGLAASDRVRQRRTIIRTCPACGESFAGIQWQAHTSRKSGCPTIPCPPRRKWAKPKVKRTPEESRAKGIESRKKYWTAERRAAWSVKKKAEFAANEEARGKCSKASRLWWESHPEAKVRSPEYREKIFRSVERLHQLGQIYPKKEAA